MIDIESQSQATLRDAGFNTWPTKLGQWPIVAFEDSAVLGFIYIFPTALELTDRWKDAEHAVLAAHAAALRGSGEKAWNVYSVFLTPEVAPPALDSLILRIDEDLARTRKIARAGIATTSHLANALLPLLPLSKTSALPGGDFLHRFRSRLSDLPEIAIAAFLSDTEPAIVAKVLSERR